MRYERAMIKHFLTHLLSELVVEKLRLDGKPVGASLLQNVLKLQTKYETKLLPNSADGEVLTRVSGPDETPLDVARQALAQELADQIRHAHGTLELIGKLKF